MNLNQRFDKLDENLKLDPEVRDKAIEKHNEINDLLAAGGAASKTRLQGSFARHTMRGPELRDIDKIVELHDDHRARYDRPGQARNACGMLRDVLAPHLPGAKFEIKRHALAITLPGKSFDFDAVPAFVDANGALRIADTDQERWEDSNTYRLMNAITERNKACDGRFVHQVRMVKQIAHHAGVDLPGLHLETFAYGAITGPMDHPAAMVAALKSAHTALAGYYFDPTGEDWISDRLKPGAAPRARATIGKLLDGAEKATALASSGEEDAAAQHWADLFGECFPRPSAKRFLQGIAAGTVGAVTPVSRRAWRP